MRERIDTPDDDFLDIDWAFAANRQHAAVTKDQPADNGSPVTGNNLVIISHGLEGDSTRPYLAGMVRHLVRNGFDCLAWHYRSCSGELNRQTWFYHIGDTADLRLVIQHALTREYQTIHLVGFSAGGNVTLKYLGEHGRAPGADEVHPAIGRAVTFSVPLDLQGATRRLEQWDSRVYNVRFSRTLRRKVVEKARQQPNLLASGLFSLDALRRTRSVREFDALFTAPVNGFRDVDDYYDQSSSLQFVPYIKVPTLIVNAQNDPFLSTRSFPIALARELPTVWMEFPAQGGHCGFVPKAGGLQAETYWSEARALQFLTQHT